MRVDDRICDHDWVGACDPPRKLKFEFCRVLDGGLVFAVGG